MSEPSIIPLTVIRYNDTQVYFEPEDDDFTPTNLTGSTIWFRAVDSSGDEVFEKDSDTLDSGLQLLDPEEDDPYQYPHTVFLHLTWQETGAMSGRGVTYVLQRRIDDTRVAFIEGPITVRTNASPNV